MIFFAKIGIFLKKIGMIGLIGLISRIIFVILQKFIFAKIWKVLKLEIGLTS